MFKIVKTCEQTTSVAALSDDAAASTVVAIELQYDDLKGEIVSLNKSIV